MNSEHTYYKCHTCTLGSQRCRPFSIPVGWMEEKALDPATGETVSRTTCGGCIADALMAEFCKRERQMT